MQGQYRSPDKQPSRRKAATSFKQRDVSLPEGNSLNTGHLRFIEMGQGQPTMEKMPAKQTFLLNVDLSFLSGSSLIAQ